MIHFQVEAVKQPPAPDPGILDTTCSRGLSFELEEGCLTCTTLNVSNEKINIHGGKPLRLQWQLELAVRVGHLMIRLPPCKQISRSQLFYRLTRPTRVVFGR